MRNPNSTSGLHPAATANEASTRSQEVLCIALMGVLLFCFAANLLIVSALMPQLVNLFGVTTKQIGLLIMVYALLSATFNLISGPLSDRIGRRKILAGAALIFGVSTITCGFATSFEAMFLLRAVNGVAVAAIGGGAYAYLADCVAKERVAGAIGMASACLYLGTAVGVPAAVYIAGVWSMQAAFLLVGLPALVAAAGIWFSLPEVPTGASASPGGVLGYRKAIQAPSGRALLIFSALSFAATFALNSFLTAWANKALNIEVGSAALAFLAGGTASLSVSLLWARSLRKIGVGPALLIGIALAAVAHLSIAGATSFTQVAVIFAIVSFAFTLRLVAIQTHLAARVPADQRGVYTSLFTAASQLGMACGPLGGGLFLAMYSFDATAQGFWEMNLVAAAISLLSLLWLKPLMELGHDQQTPCNATGVRL